VCVGAALAGQRPIGEMQFNDFVATGFNQLVNNAAKIRYRWGGSVPMVLRMPWGGLRHAGPYHSQNTEPWFYRTPGLKIVEPSTAHDAKGLIKAAIRDRTGLTASDVRMMPWSCRRRAQRSPASPAPTT
jgi:2-oxoisovalerate dehydrogenase E1 component